MNEREMLRFIDTYMINIKKRCYGWMQLKPGDRILDVGCGPGLDVQRIAQNNNPHIYAVGIDLRDAFWKHDWIGVVKQGAGFAAADAELLPFGPDTFDVVWADRVLQHVDQPIRALLEFKRVLKFDGRIVLADSDHTSATVQCRNKPYGQQLMEFRAGTIRNGSAGRLLNTWCEEVGLKVTRSETLELNIAKLDLAERMGLFFGRWDDRFRQCGRREADELAEFLDKTMQSDELGVFQYSSKFYILSARKEDL